MNKRFLSVLALIVVTALSTVWSGCTGTRIAIGDTKSPVYKNKGGPPPWAPAHGYRAKYRYRYYPNARIYFDNQRSLYFFYRNGQWEVSANLPGGTRLEVGDYVTIEMDNSKPYIYHTDVEARYPPGKSKKKVKEYKKKKKWQ